MKRYVGFLVLVLCAAPAFAQEAEESALRELGVFGIYSTGNLALRDIQRGNEPVQQLKRFFSEAKLPLTSVAGEAVKRGGGHHGERTAVGRPERGRDKASQRGVHEETQ